MIEKKANWRVHAPVKVITPGQDLGHDFDLGELRKIIAELEKGKNNARAFPTPLFFMSLVLPLRFCLCNVPMRAFDQSLPIHLFDIYCKNKVRPNAVLDFSFDGDTASLQSWCKKTTRAEEREEE